MSWLSLWVGCRKSDERGKRGVSLQHLGTVYFLPLGQDQTAQNGAFFFKSHLASHRERSKEVLGEVTA